MITHQGVYLGSLDAGDVIPGVEMGTAKRPRGLLSTLGLTALFEGAEEKTRWMNM
jgi:hypothetical protein